MGFLIVATLTVSVLQSASTPMHYPTLDALKYLDYAFNIHDHGVFGLTGTRRDIVAVPGNQNSPLYPAFVALAIGSSQELEDSLDCAFRNRDPAAAGCKMNYRAIIIWQSLLVVIALLCIWSAGTLLFGTAGGWLAAAMTLVTTKPLYFTKQILTENLILLFFAGLILLLVLIAHTDRKRYYIFAGLVVGLMALTRPEYLYLGIASIAAGAFAVALARKPALIPKLALFALAFVLSVGPWLERNHRNFDSYAITQGYSDRIIAYRVAYNYMSWSEWASAFVYWLPGHGESLAQGFLPESSYRKLGVDDHSYLYGDGNRIFERGLAAVGGDRDALTGYLIKTEIIERPFKHFFASVPLAWRGVLAGKYLAAIGFPAFLVLLLISAKQRNPTIWIVAFPAFVMIGLYAAVSVSIPRYNVYLIYYYALAVTWILVGLGRRRYPT